MLTSVGAGFAKVGTAIQDKALQGLDGSLVPIFTAVLDALRIDVAARDPEVLSKLVQATYDGMNTISVKSAAALSLSKVDKSMGVAWDCFAGRLQREATRLSKFASILFRSCVPS